MYGTPGIECKHCDAAKKLDTSAVPVCDTHAMQWFCERDHLVKGPGAECIVCAHQFPKPWDSLNDAGQRRLAEMILRANVRDDRPENAVLYEIAKLIHPIATEEYCSP